MKVFALALVVLCVNFSATATAQRGGDKPQKEKDPPKPQKKEDDLPDVAFQIPEETRGEVKAVIKDNAQRLFDKKAAERVKAAQVLGELGEQGKPVRILLCRAMLDADATVRVAAADALKSIDPKMQYLAVALITEDPAEEVSISKRQELLQKRQELLQKIKKLEDDGAPLSPLIAQLAIQSAAAEDESGLKLLLSILGSIARNDLAACNLIASALDNKSPSVRLTALKELPRMKHGKLVVRKIAVLLNTDVAENRIAAIEALTALADDSTEEILAAAIAGQRYHKDEGVRQAVDIGLNKLQNKEKTSKDSQKKEDGGQAQPSSPNKEKTSKESQKK
jgi:hypothetical protein